MTDSTGYQKMVSSQPYAAPDWDLLEMQAQARRKLDQLNAVPSFDMPNRTAMLRDQLGSFGESLVLSPVSWEYGKHIHIGDGVFINFECVFLDGAEVRIGDGTAVAPRVQFLTAGHPVEADERIERDPATGKFKQAWCINKPITIGRDCWIGAGTIILGGVTIGNGTTIGAGSVVTRDIPAGVVAAGNPCRVIGTLGKQDNAEKRANAA
jgi:acetyltransferase-like isoleucine patch superfamily enzyme